MSPTSKPVWEMSWNEVDPAGAGEDIVYSANGATLRVGSGIGVLLAEERPPGVVH